MTRRSSPTKLLLVLLLSLPTAATAGSLDWKAPPAAPSMWGWAAVEAIDARGITNPRSISRDTEFQWRLEGDRRWVGGPSQDDLDDNPVAWLFFEFGGAALAAQGIEPHSPPDHDVLPMLTLSVRRFWCRSDGWSWKDGCEAEVLVELRPPDSALVVWQTTLFFDEQWRRKEPGPDGWTRALRELQQQLLRSLGSGPFRQALTEHGGLHPASLAAIEPIGGAGAPPGHGSKVELVRAVDMQGREVTAALIAMTPLGWCLGELRGERLLPFGEARSVQRFWVELPGVRRGDSWVYAKDAGGLTVSGRYLSNTDRDFLLRGAAGKFRVRPEKLAEFALGVAEDQPPQTACGHALVVK